MTNAFHHRAALLVQVQADNKMKLGTEQVGKGRKRQLAGLQLVTPSAPPPTQFSKHRKLSSTSRLRSKLMDLGGGALGVTNWGRANCRLPLPDLFYLKVWIEP
jgi:hypothetical protein